MVLLEVLFSIFRWSILYKEALKDQNCTLRNCFMHCFVYFGYNMICFPTFLVKKVLTIFVGFKAHIRQHLSREARGCDCLVLWLDCDREGENICFEGTFPH